jgi:hypothetical protein
MDACEERRYKERREQHAHPRTKGQGPSQRVDEQAQIARVTDDTIDTAGNQHVAGLNGYQPAEPAAEHKDWPDAQRTTGSKENDAEPANGIAVDGSEFLPDRVSRQIGVQQSDQGERYEDPAVGAILALAWAHISASEKRCAKHRECCNRQCG